MNFKRITLMIKNNLGAITNSYKAKNPLKKKKVGNILLYGIIFLYLIFVEYMALSNLINSIGEANIIESVAKISPMFVAFLVIMSVFFVEFLRIINVINFSITFLVVNFPIIIYISFTIITVGIVTTIPIIIVIYINDNISPKYLNPVRMLNIVPPVIKINKGNLRLVIIVFEISTIYLSFLVIGNDLINTVLFTFIILKNSTKNTDITIKNPTNIGAILAIFSTIMYLLVLLSKFDKNIYSTYITYRNIIPYNNIFPIFLPFFKGLFSL